jgi:Na+-driven multidrug efflux pump
VIGGADEVSERLAAVAEAGATTLVASEFGAREERAATRALLISLNVGD